MTGEGGRLDDGCFGAVCVGRTWDASVGVVAGPGCLAFTCHYKLWLFVLDFAVAMPDSTSTFAVASFTVSIVHITTFRSMNCSYAKSDFLKGKTILSEASTEEFEMGYSKKIGN